MYPGKNFGGWVHCDITNSQLIFDKGIKTTQWVNKSLFNIFADKTGYPQEKEGRWILTLPYIQGLTQCIKDLNIRT
jgi:hypothetical protein